MRHDIYVGDATASLKTLPAESFQCAVTSPPYYGLKSYGDGDEIGPERTYPEYIRRLVGVFGELRRCLRRDGVLWVVVGDSYFNYRTGHNGGMPAQSIHDGKIHSKPDKVAGCNRRSVRQPGLKEKDLMGIPWRLALAMQDDGWYLRSDTIWSKTNPTPERVKDRPTKAHEYVFLFSRQPNYTFDSDAILETAVGGGTRNSRSVWEIPAETVKGHNAVFPVELARRCVAAGCPGDGDVLDPFFGSGTVGLVAARLKKGFVGLELYEKYATAALARIRTDNRCGPRLVPAAPVAPPAPV